VREIAGRFEATERWAMAWLVWRELVLRYPYSPFVDDALFHLGQIAVATGRNEDALWLWDRLAEQTDTSWRLGDYNSKLRDNAMLARADLLITLGRKREAADEYQRILDAYPKYSDGARVGWERAQLLGELGEWALWEATLRQLLAGYPDSVRGEWAQYQLDRLEDGDDPADLWQAKPERARPWLSEDGRQ